MNVKHAVQSSKPSRQSLSGIEDDGWNKNMGRPGRLILSHSHKPAQARAHMLTMLEATTGWLEIHGVPHPLPGIASWALKSKSYGYVAPQK